MRFSAGSGVAIVNIDSEIGVGIFGIGIVMLTINRDCAEYPDDDCMSENQEIAMDGGTVRR